MRKMKSYTGIVVIMIFSMFIGSCAVNPVTGKRELNLLSESEEIQLGKEADPQIMAQYGLYQDKKIHEFVDRIGKKMASISHRPDLQFHFRVLDSPIINAFALPGGYVYFTRGILGYMNSEAELAGVLGHEIGHVTARHGAKAYTRAQLAQVGFNVGYALSETFRQFGGLAETGVGLLFLSFSRDQERQSDKLGVEYSTEIGYDAKHMSNFFGTLNRMQEKSGQSLPGWFSTHPNPEEREQKTLELASEAQKQSQQNNFKTNRDDYLKLIDGIIFGEDPRQGFVENGYFYHPGLDFQFPVPTDWQLQNTPQVVQMVNKEQTAGMEFTLAQAASAREAADTFVTKMKATLRNSSTKNVNGFSAEIRETSVSNQNQTLHILSYFIKKGQNIYVFHGYGAPDDYNKNLSSFRYTMDNFDRLKNQAAKNVKPTRIKIVTVTRNETLERFLSRHTTDKASPEDLAVLNGMQLSDSLRRGTRVKVLTQ